MYERGESVFPKNVNSIGLVEMLFAGSTRPASNVKPIPLKSKSDKFELRGG